MFWQRLSILYTQVQICLLACIQLDEQIPTDRMKYCEMYDCQTSNTIRLLQNVGFIKIQMCRHNFLPKSTRHGWVLVGVGMSEISGDDVFFSLFFALGQTADSIARLCALSLYPVRICLCFISLTVGRKFWDFCLGPDNSLTVPCSSSWPVF